ncbi:MAG: hypothetical protein HY696_12315 [Deltaproteobacteria bacterium]|nr:hypothetical protein [Deltaproteobacteria bacterium]
MYHLIGLQANLANLHILAARAGVCTPLGMDQLKSAYRAFLQTCQPAVVHPPICASIFVDDAEREIQLLSVWPERQRGLPVSRTLRHATIERLQQALVFMARRCDDLLTLFDLTIHSIVVRQGALPIHASHGHALGALLLPATITDVHDLAEQLIHALTQQLVSIDTLCTPHHLTIRREPSPHRSPLQAAITTTELLLCRAEWLGEPIHARTYPSTPQLYQQAHDRLAALDRSLPTRRPRLSERGSTLIRNCAALLQMLHVEPPALPDTALVQEPAKNSVTNPLPSC